MEVPGKTIDAREGESYLNPEKVCELCQGDNITTQASGFCRDCGEFMCDTCFRHHLRVKLCRHHVMVDVYMASLPSAGNEKDTVKCRKHMGEIVRFYCRKHDYVGCGDCMIPDHNVCASESIKNLSKNFQQSEDFKTFVSKFDKLTSENKETEHTVQENKRINTNMLDKVIGDIRKFRTDVNNHLDKMEEDIISEAKQFISDNDKVLTKLEQDCKVLSSKIEEMKHMMNTEIYQDNELFINTIECKPRLSEMEQTVTQMKSKDMKQIEFVRDEQMESLVTSAKVLGKLTMPATVPLRKSSRITETKTEKTVSESSNAGESETTVQVATPAKKVGVGARVSHNRFKSTGTVKSVYLDDTVSIRWDLSGQTVGHYTVGTIDKDVSLM